MRRNEDFDASREAWLSSDQTISLEGDDHLVNRWWRNLEVTLHVGFGGRAAEHMRIGVYEGEVWPCFSVKPFGLLDRRAPDF